MAGYPGVGNVQDPATRAALEQAWKTIQSLQARLAALEATVLQPGADTIDMGGNRVINVATPSSLTDAVNLQTMQVYVQSQIKGIP